MHESVFAKRRQGMNTIRNQNVELYMLAAAYISELGES